MIAVAEVRGFREVSSPSGGPLHVRDHPGDDVPMVVMHGFPDDLRIYDRLIPSIIFGADDQFLNPDIARHLAGLFAHSDLHLVESASHWPQWDQPELVAKIMLAPPDPV
ncbi:MAG: hypothetical protein WBW80_09885 [Acidimicrobiales bacterium]